MSAPISDAQLFAIRARRERAIELWREWFYSRGGPNVQQRLGDLVHALASDVETLLAALPAASILENAPGPQTESTE